ncbi:restriction endonuclease FokI C-terminal domain-containing protein [Tetragenococcus halophilus]|uniref:restriction endonuclease FokI C-terminal domain-containing protein n=1 Tax=Tetragenococcus halophilus TaxID=51669 RepID=UPI0025AF9E14|nr:restriction endonuclease FokI C-terminal domain-containing protein [Tetragenococcus halophilus]WJS82360.1 restriction endonuclease [Tetragenococcus halophilus]
MKLRTYGWVQNPSDFKKLKLVIQIFDSKSQHYAKLRDKLVPNYIAFDDIKSNLLDKLKSDVEEFSYLDLVGTSRDKNGKSPQKRSEAVANSLIQITILPQSANTTGKKWTDNWTADGYLRWALSLNLVKHDRNSDICSITSFGKEFSRSDDNSEHENRILSKALLCYPPATQVLNILDSFLESATKFSIGNKLGFAGEEGFTSYDEGLMIDWFKNGTEEEQRKIKSDIEGTSDKYARMIAAWLEKVGFVEKHSTKLDTVNGERTGFQKFTVTAKGSHAIRQAHGSSKNKRVVKYLTWEFLAVEGKNRNYVRSRRAYILKFLQETKSFSKLLSKLNNLGFKDDSQIIENDINGLNNFGIRIEKNGNNVTLKDFIVNFSIPALNLTQELKDNVTENLKTQYMKKTKLPMKYIELLEIAFDGKKNRDFEMITADLFKNIYGFNTVLLGGGRKPDGLIFTDKFGVIIDTKAYGKGYSKSINQEDEMVRYIEDNKLRDTLRNPIEWWSNFDSTIKSDNFYFMWISSKFVGRFQEQLESTFNRTNTKGAAINVEQLLVGAAAVQNGTLSITQFPKYMNNKEIFWGEAPI